MFLRALELSGFKSFPDRTRLEFRGGITGIVGPNGSGKSNIADAIRWVMGETSYKALRGSKMEDVIFGGTQKRVQKGYCEVTLYLDNSDGTIPDFGSEVEISRRYYRTGESEYRINRQTVRLRDINELLMDTGLGRDGYSVIGQGRIDEILSVKSTDRREIFEAAAGISRYRFRKEEAGRKLEKAGQDMVRIGDKIAELELQVEPLREQSRVAKEYLSLRDKLKDLEIAVWTADLENGARREQELAEALKDTGLQKAKAESELEKLYAGGEELAEKAAAADMENVHVRDEISATEGEAAGIASRLAEIRTAVDAGRESAARLQEELQFQADREGGVEKQINQRRAHIAENAGQIAETRRQIQEIETSLSSLDDEDAAFAAQLAEAAAEESLNRQKLSDARDQLTTLSAMLQELEDRDTSLRKQAIESDERLKQERERADACREELEAGEKKERTLENQLQGYGLRCENRRRQAEKAETQLRGVSSQLDALKNRISMLREMEKDYTGYNRAVKTVMQEAEAGRLNGILGTVAQNMKVADTYATAIEVALGAAIGDIITETNEDAQSGIQLLRRRDAGRATFQPVDTVSGAELAERGLEREPGMEGIASRLISCDDKLKGIYARLLGRTVIAEDLKKAVAISRKYNHRFRLVTLDGQVVNAGGSLTGGSLSRNTGILSRANELERLAEEEKQLDARVSEAETALAQAKRELAAAENERNGVQDDLNRSREQTAALHARLDQFQILLNTLAESRAAAEEELRTLSARMGECGQGIEKARGVIAELSENVRRLEETHEAIGRMRGELAEKVSAASQNIAERRTSIAALEAENEAAAATIGELEELQRQMGGDRARQQEQILLWQKKESELNRQISEALAEQEKVQARIASLRAKAAEATEKKLALEAERARRDKRLQDANNHVLQLERDLSELQRKLDSAQAEADHIANRLWESYELSRSAALAQRKDLGISRESANRQAGSLRRQMAALGTPNLGAIDEYKRVGERYEFLTAQRDDIQKSIDELNQLITEISGNMEEIFLAEFENIRSAFVQTFHDLFGGGTAELVLDDPEHVLESGIEILAQPPGKKLRNLSLLSGGEKAYVAIALYFAILKVHAAPFVVMDEIEAALDEENVIRYASYMRQICRDTQFLVITHRRGTMEEADVLYGVTMEEQGVSKVLSIDLTEAEKTAG